MQSSSHPVQLFFYGFPLGHHLIYQPVKLQNTGRLSATYLTFDYVVKPFSPREVAARVKAILKRVKPFTATVETAPRISESPSKFVVDMKCKTIHFYRELLSLSKVEFNLLKTLVDPPGRVFSREQF